ncbi:MAG: DUF3108 domain-containing protein [Bacteroidales bacterium]|nr:DUF3108 domain-containing protein [Bacteroidales bacterium]
MQRTRCWGKNNFFPLFAVLVFLIGSSSYTYGQKRDAFSGGEKLEYSINYGIIRGGKAVLEVKEGKYNGRTVNHLYLNGRTVGLLDKLYRVDDTYQSFTDPSTDLPYMAIRDIKEGRYTKYTVQTFDHWSRSDSSIVTIADTVKVVVPKDCNDILSAFYYLRNHHFHKPLKKDDILLVETYFSDELYSLRVRFMGYETIKTRMGNVHCLKFVPVVITGRVFKNNDDMVVWFSNDNNYIPIRIKFNIFLGAIYCDLDQYSGLKYPFEALF